MTFWLTSKDELVNESFWDIIANILNRHKFSGNSNSPDTTPPTVPVVPATFLPTRKTESLRATWLGHACFYVEFPSGLRVLFDPVFERCCGPYGWLGPARFTEPPCQIEDIPFIDAVVISHSHYDHMSHPSILRVQAKFPNAQFFAPMNNKAWFESLGVKNVTEMDWWETRELKLTIMREAGKEGETEGPETMEAIIGCLPCQHMAARSPFDFMHTLWASWSVESGGKKVWFAG
jgi:N-acyl-phosphatidylethanolamine-hydrolysing phospholipase D